MKRKLVLSAILLIAMVFLFVACSDGMDLPVNKLGKISIGGNVSKAISTVVTYSSDVEDLYWYYNATKLDDGYKTGETTGFVAVSDPESKGLSGKVLNSAGFSYGLWDIELAGFRTTQTDLTETTNAEYVATIDNFLVKAEMNYANADIEVGDNATTTIEFGDIWFSADNFESTSKFKLEVKDNNQVIINSTEDVSASLIEGQSDKYEVRFKNLSYDAVVTEGEHEMKFVLTQTLSGTGNITIEAALYTLKFNVMKGTNTKIQGDMVKNDQTGDIQINSFQSVPKTIISKVIPVYNDGTHKPDKDSATVKETTTITIGDLTVTYPEGAVIVPGDNGLADDKKTSDGIVGFEYKGTTAGEGITVKANENVANYELTLSTPTGSSNSTLITIKKNIGKGLEIESVYHESDPLEKLNALPSGNLLEGTEEKYFYDKDNGILYLFVKHASPFYIISKKYVASIGDNRYTTLADAIANVQNSDTIKLLEDIPNATGLAVNTGKTFTIDFGGHTYTVNKPGAGSTGTETSAFQLIAGQTIIFKNGTINASVDNLTKATVGSNIKRFFQSYADVTFENMTIDGTNIYEENSVAEFANGTVLIKGNTNFVAKQGTKTINVDTWKGSYPAGAHVTIDTTGSMGDIYLYCEGSAAPFTPSSLTIKNGIFGSVSNGEGTLETDFTASITGGTFDVAPTQYVENEYAVYLEDTQYKVAEYNGTNWTHGKTIVGGTFSSDPSEYVYEGYEAKADPSEQGLWTVDEKVPEGVAIHNQEELTAFANGTLDGLSDASYKAYLANDINVSDNTTINFSKITCTLDLNGKTLSGNVGNHYEKVPDTSESSQVGGLLTLWTDANLTINDITGNGKIINNHVDGTSVSSSSPGYMTGGCVYLMKNSKLTLNGGTLQATAGKNNAAIGVRSGTPGEVLFINGGTVYGSGAGISNNGYNNDVNIIINGGLIKSDYTAIHHMCGGMNMTAGELIATGNGSSGVYTIYADKPTLIISGGKISGASYGIYVVSGTVLKVSGEAEISGDTCCLAFSGVPQSVNLTGGMYSGNAMNSLIAKYSVPFEKYDKSSDSDYKIDSKTISEGELKEIYKEYYGSDYSGPNIFTEFNSLMRQKLTELGVSFSSKSGSWNFTIYRSSEEAMQLIIPSTHKLENVSNKTWKVVKN